MKKFLLLGFTICLCVLLNAQKVHFMYFQSETAAPFYLKMAGRVHSSTSQGYLILSMLKDSTYSFSIGHPGIKEEEPKYSVTINKADKGFLLKNINGQLSLYDLQTSTVYKPLPNELNSGDFIKKSDKFSLLLAQAAEDMSIMYEAVVIKEQIPVAQTEPVVAIKENVKPVQETSGNASVATILTNPNPEAVQNVSGQNVPAATVATVVPNNPVNTTAIANVPANEQPQAQGTDEFMKSTVTRKAESSTSEGFGLVYLDNNNGTVDTVRLLIPNQTFIFSGAKKQQSAENRQFQPNNNGNDAVPAQPSAFIPGNEDVSGTKQTTGTDVVKLQKAVSAKQIEESTTEEANDSKLVVTVSGKKRI